ncbi:unnamed protein product [Periconia digitata]|uniref:Uncharacterized protein n=1 Tax=Periconia digitata TaxID=1303443 RepID=A0A9W4U1B9_9PLEO|nr:unnamed protein product [Periconia digitata]
MVSVSPPLTNDLTHHTSDVVLSHLHRVPNRSTKVLAVNYTRGRSSYSSGLALCFINTMSEPSESPAQERARLRREKRAAGGASRLQAISKLQGGTHRDVEDDVVKPISFNASQQSGTATPDPEEIDISQHHYTPASQPRRPSPFSFDSDSAPSFGPGQPPGMDQDMMAMMQQIMGASGGGMPGAPGQQPGAPGDIPPGLGNLLSAMQGGDAQQPSPEKSSAWVWRLVHALFSFALASYIVLKTPFTGSKVARSVQEKDDWAELDSTNTFGHFFYLFATFEVILQSSRFFVEKGQLQGSGLLSTVGQLLPQPYAGYVRVIGRYSVIYNTVVADAMVVVFVLGATSWWNGIAAV